jgi:hypothetical protein
VKRLNKLLLALFVLTGSLFLFSQKVNAIETKCSESSIDVRQYVAPQCDGTCPVVGSSSVGEGFAYIGNVTNFVEWINGDHFKQNSNDIHFLYEQGSSTINFKQDTIWGGGDANGFFTCDGTNDEAFYRVYSSNGTWGRSILDNTMSCGDTHTSSGYIRSFKKDPNLIESNPLVDSSQLQECNVSGQSNIETTGSSQLIFQGTAICNSLNPIDVIVTTNTGGAGAGETLVYCKGYGLCAWYQTMDFEENSPADWDETTDVCALDAAITETLNRDPYFVEPINGMYDYALNGYEDPGNLIFDKVYEDLVAQGYQAYCSIPDLQYIASSNTNNIMLEDMMGKETVTERDGAAESKPGNRVEVSLEDYKQFFNYIDSQTPLWRKKGVFVLKDKDSLEGFWSHKDETVRAGFTSADFSPAYTLSTPEDQCREKRKILSAVNKKCKTLENPETCALDISYDPNSLSYVTLYDLIETTGFSCESMKVPIESLNPTQLSIRDSLLSMPFTLPTSYRYAFVIYSAELREPRISSETFTFWEPTTRKPGFDFLRYADGVGRVLPEPNAKPRSEVRILAFLFPDFTTNQDDFDFTYTPPPEKNYPSKSTATTPRRHIATYGPPNDFNDSVKFARNSIQEPELQDAYKTLWRAKKAGATIPNPFKENGLPIIPFENVFDPDSEEDKLIECLYFDGKPTPDEYSCVEPMEKALTTFVNRRIENADDCNESILNWEENSVIYDDAGLTRSDAGLYHLYNGSSVHALAGLNNTYSGESVHMLESGLYPNDIANVIHSNDDTSLPPITDEARQVFEFRFLSHYAFTSFYDGNDPLYGGEEPERSQDPKAVIHGYLVYPQGYELEAAETTFLNEFLIPKQIEEFEEQYDKELLGDDVRDTWFKMSGVEQSMPGKSASYTGDPSKFMFVSEDSCQNDYDAYVRSLSPEETPISYGAFRDQSCKKTPSATITSEPQIDKEPRILGARLGLITIKIQQTLRLEGTPSWDYVTSCLESDTPTEDFLTGRCSGIVERDGLQDNEDEPETGYMNEAVATCTGSDRVVNDIGSYTLPPSEFACTLDDSITGESDMAVEYTDSVHGIDNWLNDQESQSDRVNCDEAFFSFVACSFNEDTAYKPSLIAHLVDSSGNFTRGGSKTACEYVQDRAEEQNVSPRLALSIWLEETGASAYSTETGGPDFGVLSAPTSRQSGSIEPQLRLFLGTINSNRNIAYPRFLLQYSGEYLYGTDPTSTWRDWQVGDPVLFCRNRGFAGRLKNFYEQLRSY